jgi:two-component system OmpR family response regulator
MQEEPGVFPRHERALTSLDRWTQSSGAPLLVIDPLGEDNDLRIGMASFGVHVTWARSALDGLIEFGRTSPCAVRGRGYSLTLT